MFIIEQRKIFNCYVVFILKVGFENQSPIAKPAFKGKQATLLHVIDIYVNETHFVHRYMTLARILIIV